MAAPEWVVQVGNVPAVLRTHEFVVPTLAHPAGRNVVLSKLSVLIICADVPAQKNKDATRNNNIPG